jgi:6-phosphogluconate dehydrogenase
MTAKADIGLIGLAVMGQNLVLNMDDHGFTVAVYNRTTSKVDEFLSGAAAGTRVIGTHSIEELVAALKKPRRVMLMVKAGQAVDDFIELLLPHLEPGDIIIDAGNSNFNDTIRRTAAVEAKGLLYIGTGVLGGYWVTGWATIDTKPAITMMSETTVAKTGRSMKNLENMGWRLLGLRSYLEAHLV